MNSKERILAAIRLEEPDRVPCSPHFSAGIARRMPDEEWQALQKWTDVTMTVKSLTTTTSSNGNSKKKRSKSGIDPDNSKHNTNNGNATEKRGASVSRHSWRNFVVT